MKLLFPILLLFCVVTVSFAQNEETKTLKLTEADIIEFKQRASDKIVLYMDNLPKLAKKKDEKGNIIPLKTKEYYKSVLCEIFKDEGKTCIKEVSHIAKNGDISVKKYFVPQYLDRLIQSQTFFEISIVFADFFYLSNLYPVGNNEYMGTATLYQRFVGYGKDKKPIYEDLTGITIQVHVKLIEDMYGTRWAVLLGDMSVKETFSE
jgi:hypothetical protein